MKTRIEHDLLGAKEVPAQAYWGVHTARAVENFPITGTTIGRYEHLICALAVVKQAAARTNADLGLLSNERAAAIAKKAHVDNLSLREAAVALGLLSGEQFDRLVRPEAMVGPNPPDAP